MANKNTYALITGGSSGIGYEIARDLASRGYNLILISRSEKNLKNWLSKGVVEGSTLKVTIHQNTTNNLV